METLALLMEQSWNDARQEPVHVNEAEEVRAELLAWGIERCNVELFGGYRHGVRVNGHTVWVDLQGMTHGASRFLVAVCEEAAQGGWLGKQLDEIAGRMNGSPVVLVRSTMFPRTARAAVTIQIGRLIGTTGRKVEVEDSDWRTLQSFRQFHRDHGDKPQFSVWQKSTRPLSQLAALRRILALDKLPPPPAMPDKSAAVPSEAAPLPKPPPLLPPLHPPGAPVEPLATGPMKLGTSRGAIPAPVNVMPAELTQHMAFLGASGSGKSTAALLLIEQLLLRGIPAILLDRKGDLARYADPDAWQTPSDPTLAAALHRLHERVDVALYTPGSAAAGRPLAIPVVPDGIQQLPTAEREQLAQFTAAALGGMMGYKSGRRAEQIPLVILAKTIEVLAEATDAAITLDSLRELVENQDAALLSTLAGGYDAKAYKNLGQDLLTLRLTHGRLMETAAEKLDIDSLLGRGAGAIPGKTRLSIINTQSLASAGIIDFWCSQFFVALDRWRAKSPSDTLQAVVFLDEADQYLPAVRQPTTKAPLESLLHRAARPDWA